MVELIDFGVPNPEPVPLPKELVPDQDLFPDIATSSNPFGTGSFSFTDSFNSTFGLVGEFFSGVWGFLLSLFDGTSGLFIKILLTLLALLAVYIIFYYYIRIERLEKEEREKIKDHVVAHKAKEQEVTNATWSKISEHMESSEEIEWKMAIMEADIMLEDVLTDLGYEGESVADKLKIAEEGGMKYVNEAWEAHKVRNKIAHQGMSFELPQREAKRIISLYEQVFRGANYL